jgi:phosphate/sulfate permease
MKNVFKKLISRDLLEPLLVAFGAIAIFQWVVAPGLSTNITLVNILSAVIGFITIIFMILYVKEFIFPPNKTDHDISEGGETELDYESAPVKKTGNPRTKRKPATKAEPEVAKENQVTKNKK